MRVRSRSEAGLSCASSGSFCGQAGGRAGGRKGIVDGAGVLHGRQRVQRRWAGGLAGRAAGLYGQWVGTAGSRAAQLRQANAGAPSRSSTGGPGTHLHRRKLGRQVRDGGGTGFLEVAHVCILCGRGAAGEPRSGAPSVDAVRGTLCQPMLPFPALFWARLGSHASPQAQMPAV